mmetsp:Transcript_71202/g.117934  ORF Transcript_71202/g.117934 Transcript_71202/m.117934 type:complete len:113 (+) Transcript_71202:536-874(+)
MGTARGTPIQVASDPASDVRADGRDARIVGAVRKVTFGERVPRSRITEPDFTIALGTEGGTEGYPLNCVTDLSDPGDCARVCITGERETINGEAVMGMMAVRLQSFATMTAN